MHGCEYWSVSNTGQHNVAIVVSKTLHNIPAEKWPNNPTHQSLKNGFPIYDFIVIGGGIAGSEVACRLNEIPSVHVALFERGKHLPMDSTRSFFTEGLSRLSTILDILRDRTATKILFEGKIVDIRNVKDIKILTKKIILSAGAVASPKILRLSGIGSEKI